MRPKFRKIAILHTPTDTAPGAQRRTPPYQYLTYCRSTKETLHPAMVKADERNKLYLSTQGFFHYTTCRQPPWERNRVWKLRRLRELDKDCNISWWEKRTGRDLEFLSGSYMLVYWIRSSLRLPLDPPPKLRLINFRLLASSMLKFNFILLLSLVSPFKNESSPPFCLVSAEGTSTYVRSAHA